MLPLLLPLLGPIVDKLIGFIPDPQAAAKAKQEAMDQLMSALSAADDAQNKINLAEAGSASMFVAGARPFIMWVCGVALAWVVLGAPFLTFAINAFGYNPTLPTLDTSWISVLLIPMLGLGGMRTLEKIQGVQTNAIATPGGAAPRQAAAPSSAGGNGRG